MSTTTEKRHGVVTYRNPSGGTRLSICPECADRMADDWPRDRRTGEEVCDVSRGGHWGVCDVHEAAEEMTQ